MLQIRRLSPDAKMPVRSHPTDIGLDIHALLISESGRPNTLIVPPRTSKLIPTGLAVKPPDGYAILVCSRSGLAMKSIFVTNAPGVVDPGYRGEIKVLLYNGNHETYYVKHEDRIAQLILFPALAPRIQEVEGLDETERGEAGFGSTGR